MDSSRYIRRQTQTQRQTPNQHTGSDILPVHSRRPALKDPITQLAPQAVKPKPPITAVVPTLVPAKKQALNKIAPALGVTQSMTPESTPHTMRIDMGLPGSEPSFYQAKLMVYGHRWSVASRWAFRGVAVLLVIFIGFGGLLFSQGYVRLHEVFRGGSKPVAALQKNVSPSLLKTEGDGRINILLLGRGGGDHDGPDLTDTMMLASIDPLNHDATLLSIPRDLWIDVPNQGDMKINAAWEAGEFKYEGKVAPGSTDPKAIEAGFEEADQSVEAVLGVTIDDNRIMDFQAFQQAVDIIGGITINVPTELYDPTMAWENDNNPILAEPGVQTFNGGQTLTYVRSRETTSDFARAQRQRAVLLAIKQKAETLGTISNPLKLSGLMNDFGNNVATDMSFSDAESLYSVVKDITNSNVASIGLADAPNNYVTSGSEGGQSVDVPTAGLYNYSAIQTYVRSQLKDPYLVKENAKVLVLNGTLTPGLATSEASLLSSYGYNVIGSANTTTNQYDQTVLVDLSKGKDKYTAHYLEQRLNVTATTTLPDKSIQTKGADFVIIIGNDEAFAS
jgi:LCP family protein required for cell wall assembly